MMRRDNMETFIGGKHGFCSFNSPGIRGHLRPIHHDIGIVDELRPGVLYDVGGGLDKSSNFEYICTIQLPGGDTKGEKQWQK